MERRRSLFSTFALKPHDAFGSYEHCVVVPAFDPPWKDLEVVLIQIIAEKVFAMDLYVKLMKFQKKDCIEVY